MPVQTPTKTPIVSYSLVSRILTASLPVSYLPVLITGTNIITLNNKNNSFVRVINEPVALVEYTFEIYRAGIVTVTLTQTDNLDDSVGIASTSINTARRIEKLIHLLEN